MRAGEDEGILPSKAREWSEKQGSAKRRCSKPCEGTRRAKQIPRLNYSNNLWSASCRSWTNFAERDERAKRNCLKSCEGINKFFLVDRKSIWIKLEKIKLPEAGNWKERFVECEALDNERLGFTGKGISWPSEIDCFFGEGKESSLEVSLPFYGERLSLKATDKIFLWNKMFLKRTWTKRKSVYWARKKMILFSDVFKKLNSGRA